MEHTDLAVCCSVLQCVAICCSAYQPCVKISVDNDAKRVGEADKSACCSVLQCVAVRYNRAQCVAVLTSRVLR